MLTGKLRCVSSFGRLTALTVLVVASSGCGANANTQTANTALVTSVVAVVVAGAQTVFTWRQARIQEDQRNSSVWPRLTFNRSVGGEKRDDPDAGGAGGGKEGTHMSFGVINKGIGPAVVRSFRVTLDGVDVPGPSAFVTSVYGPHTTVPFNFSSIEGEVLSPGETVTVLALQEGVEDAAPFRNALVGVQPSGAWRLGASICYCSVFDQCWVEELDGEPVLTPYCPVTRSRSRPRAATASW